MFNVVERFKKQDSVRSAVNSRSLNFCLFLSRESLKPKAESSPSLS